MGMSWTEYFQKEQDVWVMNISNTQVSLSFEVSSGHYASELIPLIAEPVHLTARVPFGVIKNSMDFRKQLDRTPPVLKLMTERDLAQHYARKANRDLTDVQTAMAKSAAAVAAAREKKKDTAPTHQVVGGKIIFSPPKSLQELQGITPEHMGVPAHLANQLPDAGIPQHMLRGQDVAAQMAQQTASHVAPMGWGEGEGPNLGLEAIHPRVVDLCHQASPALPENDRIKAVPLQTQLEQVGRLNRESLEYIEAKVPYAAIKRWARASAAELDAPDLTPADDLFTPDNPDAKMTPGAGFGGTSP